MNFGEALLSSLEVTLWVFAALLLIGLVPLIWRKPPKRTWRLRLPRIARFSAIRAVLALAVGASFFVITLAALTLNASRPSTDTTPVVRVLQPTGPAIVTLSLDDCGDPATGRISAPPLKRGPEERPGSRPSFARVYSDDDGFQKIRLDRRGRGTFELSDPSSRRGLLSCFMQLPIVSGARGQTTIKLELSDFMKVDTTESAPNPNGFFSGSWLWRCPAGQTCPSMATIEYAVEDGTKQVIVLILASILGAIIAILFTEIVISGFRRRLLERSED